MDKNFRIRLGVAFMLLVLLGAGVISRAAYLMLFPSERLNLALKRQFPVEPPPQPRRGYILDRNKEPLAVSMEVRSLYANPIKIEDTYTLANQLAKILGQPASVIRLKLRTKKSFIWVKRQLTEAETNGIEDLMEKYRKLNAVIGLAKESKRFYPNQALGAQIIGYTDLDSKGIEGLELTYQKELLREIEGKKNRDGTSLLLTLDKSLQYTLEKELERGVLDAGGVAGSAMVMDADTGNILAMGSYPNYNPNAPGVEHAGSRRNRLVTDTFEPGSTVKPLLVAGALELKLITPTSKVFCENGKFKIGKHTISEAESKDKWGWLTVGEVLQKSSNIGALKIGSLFAPNLQYSYYKKIGLSLKTGSDLPGEVNGRIPSAESWSKVAQANLSFGQGLAITPIQLARAYAAIVNGGNLVVPRIVSDLYTFEGEFIKKIPEGAKVKVLERSTAETMVGLLSGVATSEGTAPKAAIPGFVVAGKTGTAQKAFPGRGYKTGKYVASFIGFVRGVNPKHVVFVMVDEPKFPYYGGEAAAPIFKRIMMADLAREGIAPNVNMMQIPLLGELPKGKHMNLKPVPLKTVDQVKWVNSGVDHLVLRNISGSPNWEMPDLHGATARQVLDVFNNRDLNVRVQGSGRVIDQDPKQGAEIKDGDSVLVRLERETDLP